MTSISGTSYSGGTYQDHIEVADFATGGLDASERIGRRIERPRSRTLRRAALLFGLGGIGAASYADPSFWQRAWTIAAPSVAAIVEMTRSQLAPAAATSAVTDPQKRAAETPPDRVAAIPAEKSPVPSDPPPGPAMPAAPSPPTALPPIAPPAKPAPKAALAETARPTGDAYTAPKAVTADPLTRRAEAAGLHPDLSRALLQRLTDGDFKSAATAIHKALAEVGDTETFVWPRKAATGATRFRISFVQGAPQDCRRYVVEIAKDGWQTTALPVEKCGIKRDVARGKS